MDGEPLLGATTWFGAISEFFNSRIWTPSIRKKSDYIAYNKRTSVLARHCEFLNPWVWRRQEYFLMMGNISCFKWSCWSMGRCWTSMNSRRTHYVITNKRWCQEFRHILKNRTKFRLVIRGACAQSLGVQALCQENLVFRDCSQLAWRSSLPNHGIDSNFNGTAHRSFGWIPKSDFIGNNLDYWNSRVISIAFVNPVFQVTEPCGCSEG